MSIAPLYTADNTRAAYQLNWALSLFANAPFPNSDLWLPGVTTGAERDGVRILEWRYSRMDVVQFFLSTLPAVSPAAVIKSIKGRFQNAIRSEFPKLFRRNYRIESVGSASVDQTLDYIALQPQRHAVRDSPTGQEFADRQLCDPDVDLNAIRYSAHGQFVHNLHLVVELQPETPGFDVASLDVVRQVLRKMCAKHGWHLGRAGLVTDHIHLGLGCEIDEVPQVVALAVLNNLAFAFGMRPLFRFSYYAGTFGPFNRGAIRHAKDRHFSPTDPVSVVPCLMATPSQIDSQSKEKHTAEDTDPDSVATRQETTDAGSVGRNVSYD